LNVKPLRDSRELVRTAGCQLYKFTNTLFNKRVKLMENIQRISEIKKLADEARKFLQEKSVDDFQGLGRQMQCYKEQKKTCAEKGYKLDKVISDGIAIKETMASAKITTIEECNTRFAYGKTALDHLEKHGLENAIGVFRQTLERGTQVNMYIKRYSQLKEGSSITDEKLRKILKLGSCVLTQNIKFEKGDIVYAENKSGFNSSYFGTHALGKVTGFKIKYKFDWTHKIENKKIVKDKKSSKPLTVTKEKVSRLKKVDQTFLYKQGGSMDQVRALIPYYVGRKAVVKKDCENLKKGTKVQIEENNDLYLKVQSEDFQFHTVKKSNLKFLAHEKRRRLMDRLNVH